MRKFLSLMCLLSVVACAADETKVVPGIVPATVQETKIIKVMPNNIIGAVERVYLPPMKSAFLAQQLRRLVQTKSSNLSVTVKSGCLLPLKTAKREKHIPLKNH